MDSSARLTLSLVVALTDGRTSTGLSPFCPWTCRSVASPVPLVFSRTDSVVPLPRLSLFSLFVELFCPLETGWGWCD